MRSTRIYLSLIFFYSVVGVPPTLLHAQNTNINGIINIYTAVNEIDTCSGYLSIQDTTGFRSGTTALIIQMQGATVASGNNAQFGQLQNIGSAGFYEKIQIDSVGPNQVFFRQKLLQTYQVEGRVQLITLPAYHDVVVTDTLRALPWNGTIGGVIAFSAAGNLQLQAPILANGVGFRGGQAFTASINNCSFLIPQIAYFYDAGNWRGAYKGEGIASSIPGKEFGRGAIANGGGGGNDHNSGGGGGAHLSAGGKGGNNDEPQALGCDGFFPGIGGWQIATVGNRLFMGGGGGAGHANNGNDTRGGHGGGIILIQASTLDGQQYAIAATGQQAPDVEGDGGGGGGAGGAIWLQVDSIISLALIAATGGAGGRTDNFFQNRCSGPGGGGAGGSIFTTIANIPIPQGGIPGIVFNSTNGCNGQSNDAQAGAAGQIQPLAPIPEGTFDLAPKIITGPGTIQACIGKDAVLNVQTNPGAWTYQWQYMPDNSWINLTNNTLYSGAQSTTLHISTVTSDISNIPFRCIISRPACSMIVSNEAFIELLETPNAQFSAQQNNNTITFINQSTNANQYHWDFGDMNSDTSALTTHTYLQDGQYNVILTAWNGCDTSIFEQVIDIYTIPDAEFEIIGNPVGCFAVNLQFNNTSSVNATAWNWTFPGGTPVSSSEQNPEISYTNSGQYTVTLIASNGGGADTSTQLVDISVFSFPIAGFTFQVGADGSVDFTYSGQGATSVSWDFGDGVQGDTSLNPTHIYLEEGEYVVSLTVINPCGASTIQQNVSVIVSAAQDLKNHQRLLYPNPTSGKCYLQLDPNKTVQSVQLRNAVGALQSWQAPNSGTNIELDLTHLPDGIYWCQLIQEHQCFDFKIVKQSH